jgi:sensor domain CHASE-containing protein
MMDQLFSAAVAACVTSVGFIIHLGSRVSVLEAEQKNLKEWLERIERKLDSAIATRRHQ